MQCLSCITGIKRSRSYIYCKAKNFYETCIYNIISNFSNDLTMYYTVPVENVFNVDDLNSFNFNGILMFSGLCNLSKNLEGGQT